MSHDRGVGEIIIAEDDVLPHGLLQELEVAVEYSLHTELSVDVALTIEGQELKLHSEVVLAGIQLIVVIKDLGVAIVEFLPAIVMNLEQHFIVIIEYL